MPAKTHWARPIDTAPYYGYALKPGVTFTYLGLHTDDTAAVRFNNQPSDNLFVAGEMMAGNVLGKGYTAGVGMSIGTAFGRIAGTNAALASKRPPALMQKAPTAMKNETPTLVTSCTALPPEGARFALGRPGDKTGANNAVA